MPEQTNECLNCGADLRGEETKKWERDHEICLSCAFITLQNIIADIQEIHGIDAYLKFYKTGRCIYCQNPISTTGATDPPWHRRAKVCIHCIKAKAMNPMYVPDKYKHIH